MHADLMATELHERCWRAWWEELTPAQRHYWHASAHRPYLTAEQAQLLRGEGLPLLTLPSAAGTPQRVLFPLDLADLLEQDTADL